MSMSILPNISTMERVRVLYSEIVLRRLADLSLVADEEPRQEYLSLCRFLFDSHFNVYPHNFVTETNLTTEWNRLTAMEHVKHFIYSVMIELRQRAFDSQNDYDEFLDLVTASIVQFNDKASLIPATEQENLPLSSVTRELIGGNSWAIFYLLLEQTDVLNAWGEYVGAPE